MISTGTIVSNAPSGRTSSSTAPAAPPSSEALSSRRTRERWPTSSSR